MDAGNYEKIRWRSRSRAPLRQAASTVYVPPLRSSSSSIPSPRKISGDRFIPVRSAIDFGFAQGMLTESTMEKERENTATAATSSSKGAYRKLLAEVLLNNRTRILAFRSRPPESTCGFLSSSDTMCSRLPKSKKHRHISETAERTLDAPGLLDDYYLNLLDWGSSDVLSIALENTVYMWNYSAGSVSELMTVDEDIGPVTSISWAPDGKHLAVGLNNSDIQLWDSSSSRLVRTLRGVHQSRVGSLAWNNNILTTGGKDSKIVNNDVRLQSHAVQIYQGHTQEVCGLKWSGSGQQLASGGGDSLVHIWDLSMASSTPSPDQNQWVHRFEDHTAAVKALAWCTFQSNLLASGGGSGDQCIKFWSTQTGACLNSVDTGSQVYSLLWNKHERELLSSHGLPKNQLTLWKYPSLLKTAELTGHTSRVLFMAQVCDNPVNVVVIALLPGDYCCVLILVFVASAAGNEALKFWNVFGTPAVAKPTAKTSAVPFSSYYHIR